MSDPRRDKRWRREHRPKVVYTPKTNEEGRRRAGRATGLVGTPFVRLPAAVPDDQALAFTAKDGTPIIFEAVEMVFNDSLLIDAVSNWGQDGPLYRDTLGPRMREVYDFALAAYKDVPLPEAYRSPQ